MVSLNRTEIIGNIGSDIEMRFTPTGKPVASFRVATNESYTNSEGEKKENTEWFFCVVWNKLAENCNQYLHKGSLVFVEGRMRTRSWESQDNIKHYKTELIARTVKFLDKLNANQAPKTENTEEVAGEVEPEDIPF
jgi:single-strand DNA-binding protein